MINFEIICSMAKPLDEEVRRKRKEKKEKWNGTNFLSLVDAAPGTKGAVGRKLVASICKASGFRVSKKHVGARDVAFLVDDCAVSVKFAMLGEEDLYIFEQIRDSDYKILFLLGVSPKSAHAWVFLKESCFPHLENQGKRKEEKWIHIRPDIRPDMPPQWITPKSPPEWMREQTGNLDNLGDNLRKILEQ